MSAAEETVIDDSLDSVSAILKEFIRLHTVLADLKEDFIARGVPGPSVNALVEVAKDGQDAQLKKLKTSAIEMAELKFGKGALPEKLFDDHLSEMLDIEFDLSHVRKVSKGFDLNAQATNLLVQVVRTNPGDNGQQVTSLFIEYANEIGLRTGSPHLVVDNTEQASKSVLPDIQIADQSGKGIARYRDLAIEVLLGITVTWVALSLLT